MFWARRDLGGIPPGVVGVFFLAVVGFGVAGGVVGWLLVEMWIVDASIFVVKLSRANGGCLGTGSR